MDDIRTQIQTKLNELTTINSGPLKPDGMVEAGETYFGYTLQESYQGEDFEKNYAMEISLTGNLVRKYSSEEDTIKIVDTALEDLKLKLKALNFKYSYNDVSAFQDGFTKIAVRANVKYDELNKTLIL